MINVRTLGPCAVTVDGTEPPAELLWRKHLALLVYLARSPHRARTRDHLIGVLWGDRPQAAARHSLREAVHVLRRAAGDAAVDAEGEQVRLADGIVELDVERLEALAGAGDWAGAAALAAGEFLEGFSVPDAPPFEDWLGAERVEWRRRCVDALVKRAQELLRAGQPGDGAQHAARAAALDPLSEAAAAALMYALALAGERAAALAAYDAVARRLATELGGEPGEDLRRLAERVRRERTWRLPEEAAAERRGAESRRAPLVGRTAPLTALLGAWDACRASRAAALAFLEGDPGTGKTRLADELLARARLAGAAATAARAVSADEGEPWNGLLGLANGGLLEAPGLSGAPTESLAAFAARLPAWADRFPEARKLRPHPLGRAFVDVLRAACDEQPLAVLLDDAHWADPESLRALATALRDLAALPLFVLLTTSQHDRPELDELQTRLGRDVPGCTVRLGALGAEELRALAAWAMPGYDATEVDRLARRVTADSAGLPLLAVELLHAVALGLDLHGAESGAAWPAANRTLDESLPGDLPQGVTSAVRMGYRRLTKDAQTALAAASVLGDRVTADLLARAAGLEPDRVTAALDELEWQRWLAADGRGYAFVARIVRDIVARDMLTEGKRRRIVEAARGA